MKKRTLMIGCVILFLGMSSGLLQADGEDVQLSYEVRFLLQDKSEKLVSIFRKYREYEDKVILDELKRNHLVRKEYSAVILDIVWKIYTKNHGQCAKEKFLEKFHLREKK